MICVKDDMYLTGVNNEVTSCKRWMEEKTMGYGQEYHDVIHITVCEMFTMIFLQSYF